MNWQELPSHSRVWIYQADRILSEEEINLIQKKSSEFVTNWSSHGTPLEASIDFFYGLFLVVFVNEAQAMASGCSIDKSVGLVRELEKTLQIDFMNRMLVAVAHDHEIELLHLHDLSEQLQSNKITLDTLVFNNLVATKKEFESVWKVKISESWHQQFV